MIGLTELTQKPASCVQHRANLGAEDKHRLLDALDAAGLIDSAVSPLSPPAQEDLDKLIGLQVRVAQETYKSAEAANSHALTIMLLLGAMSVLAGVVAAVAIDDAPEPGLDGGEGLVPGDGLELAGPAFRAGLASMRHEGQYTRLFRS